MEIILGKTAGFCYGVKNTIQKTEEKLKQHQHLSCLGELVHNGQVVKKLAQSGLQIVENIDQATDKVIIRAHGVSKETYQQAQALNLEVFDFTCPNVLRIHKIAEEAANQGYFIFLIGEKKHPENIGTISFCGANSCVIETAADIATALQSFHKSQLKKLLIVVQTTFNLTKFNQFVAQIKQELADDVELQIQNTICNATKIKQDETAKIAQAVDCMIIIGGKNSSNTNKLYDIAKANCPHAVIVEAATDLDVNYVKQFEKVGIMAGASTPDDSIKDIIALLQN